MSKCQKKKKKTANANAKQTNMYIEMFNTASKLYLNGPKLYLNYVSNTSYKLIKDAVIVFSVIL